MNCVTNGPINRLSQYIGRLRRYIGSKSPDLPAKSSMPQKNDTGRLAPCTYVNYAFCTSKQQEK
jgi:hypothetical protein